MVPMKGGQEMEIPYSHHRIFRTSESRHFKFKTKIIDHGNGKCYSIE